VSSVFSVADCLVDSVFSVAKLSELSVLRG
jgi:hypothetical protein